MSNLSEGIFAEELSLLHRTDCNAVCLAVTLFVYDYILTSQDEVKFIWRAKKWSYGKPLFLFIRYTGFLVMTGFLFVDFTDPVSYLPCQVIMYLLLCTTTVVTLSSALVLALRTWAIWNRSLISGVIVGVSWTSVSVLSLTFEVYSIIGILPDNNAIPGLAGCESTYSPSTAAASLKIFIFLAVYEGLILVMTLARGLRYLYKPSGLMLLLYRDAFLASTCLLALTITNAILSSMNSPSFYLPFLLSAAFYHIIPCRIILNLRKSVSYIDGWDLATTRLETTRNEQEEEDEARGPEEEDEARGPEDES